MGGGPSKRTYLEDLKEQEIQEKQNETNEAIQQAIVDASKPPDPAAIKQDPNTANDELKRQKRLEALRAGLLSTIKPKTVSLGSNNLFSPAQSIYGSMLKSKLG